jgi:hypothetical protein
MAPHTALRRFSRTSTCLPMRDDIPGVLTPFRNKEVDPMAIFKKKTLTGLSRTCG